MRQFEIGMSPNGLLWKYSNVFKSIQEFVSSLGSALMNDTEFVLKIIFSFLCIVWMLTLIS